MNQHNYGRDDYPTYSQDPEWQRLHREAYPDLYSTDTVDQGADTPQDTAVQAQDIAPDADGSGPDHPPLDTYADSADNNKTPFENLSDYMNQHNYGRDDYPTYSQDPEWQRLHREAYPDLYAVGTANKQPVDTQTAAANESEDISPDVTKDKQSADVQNTLHKLTSKDVVGEDEYKKYQDIYNNVDTLNVSDDYRDILRDEIKNMDPELKGLYNDYANDLKCLDTNYPGVAHFSQTEGGFKFSETNDINKGLGAGNTFFHESGHMLDYLSGEKGQNLSECNDLTKAIQEDYDDALANIMRNENCSYAEAQSKLSDILWNDPTASSCVSDVFGGISGNKVSGPWGHRNEYWARRNRSAIGKEAFAEMTADSASNAQGLAFTQKYMPKAYRTYQNMIKGARKQ